MRLQLFPDVSMRCIVITAGIVYNLHTMLLQLEKVYREQMHRQQFRLLMTMIRQMSLFFLQLSRKTDSRQVLYLIKILLYSLISVLTVQEKLHIASVMMNLINSTEEPARTLYSYALRNMILSSLIRKLHLRKLKLPIHSENGLLLTE